MRELTEKLGKVISGVLERIFKLIRYINDNKKLARSISVVFIVILFVYLFFSLKDDTQLIINSFSGFQARNLGASFILYGINFYIFYEIWRLLLIVFGFNYSKLGTLKVYSSTYLTKFIPSPIFLYASRIAQLEKIGVSPKKSVAITALEFIFQIVVGIILYGIINIRIDQPITWLWLIVIILLIGILLNPKVFNNEVFKEVNNLKFDKKKISAILIIGLFPWLLGGLFFLFILMNFYRPPLPINFIDLWGIWIIANVSSLIGSYLLGGLGLLREFTLVLMLQKYFPPAISVIIAATVRVMLIACGVIWALVVYFSLALITKNFRKQ